MATRSKIALTIVSVLLVLGLGTVGVFAAVSTGMSASNGEVEFSATNVYVTVEGKVEDKNGPVGGIYKAKNFSEVGGVSIKNIETWNIPKVTLDENNTAATYSLYIKNEGNKAITVEFTDQSPIASIPEFAYDTRISTDGENFSAYTEAVTVEAGESIYYVVDVELIKFNKELKSVVAFAVNIK